MNDDEDTRQQQEHQRDRDRLEQDLRDIIEREQHQGPPLAAGGGDPEVRLRHTKEIAMKVSEMMPSKYLKTSDVAEDSVVTVKELKKVNVAREDEDAEYKWTVVFHEFPKPMVLNKTNLLRLQKALGDDTDGWIGNSVVLYVDDEVQYGAETVSGLRLRAVKNPITKARAALSDADVNAKLRAAEDPPF